MKRIVNLDKVKRYIAKHNSCTLQRAQELVDEGVENINWLNIKYKGFGKFEIIYS